MNALAQMAETTGDPRWAALAARDAAADGRFFYSVRTTGVYCRPSCASRPANPKNVGFHATAAEAAAAGFRPCKRCKPDQPSLEAQRAAVAAEACRIIAAAQTPPDLETLARAVGFSPHHFHRLFKAATGLTPRAYAAAHRAGRLRDSLATSGSVTEAIYDAGFNASSRFYAAADSLLGMTASVWRRGGEATQIRFAVGECSLGSILVGATAAGVCAILIGDDPDALVRDLQDRFPRAHLTGGDAGFERTVAQVVGLVEGPGVGVDLPLDVRGTAFQQRVWRALTDIPAGSTASYAEVAAQIGAPKAMRAVAGACAANPLAVAIPCHRVVRTDGSMGGYRWGVARKRTLLEREAARLA